MTKCAGHLFISSIGQPNWWGGALELYPTTAGPEGISDPECVSSKRIPISFNQLRYSLTGVSILLKKSLCRLERWYRRKGMFEYQQLVPFCQNLLRRERKAMNHRWKKLLKALEISK